MLGLLSDDEDKQQAQRAGLLNFGAALLASQSPNFGSAMGNGLMVGAQGYQGSLEAQRKRMEEDMRMRQLKIQTDEAERGYRINSDIDRAAQESMRSPSFQALMNGGGPTNANANQIPNLQPQFDQSGFLNRVMAIDPIKGMALQQSMAKDTPFNKVDPKDYTAESVAKFVASRNYADLVPVRKKEFVNGQAVDPYSVQTGTIMDNIDPNQPFSMIGGKMVPNTPFQSFAISKAQAGAARNNVDARTIHTQESEQSKVYGKNMGELRSAIATAGFSAPSTLAKLDRMEQLYKGFDGGRLSPVGLELASAANSIGIKLDPKIGNAQAAESLARELAGSLRVPGSGNMTDADFENFMQQVPSLSKTAEGRQQIFSTMRAKAARDIEIAKLSREYAKRNNGVIDDGFLDVVSDYVAKNPVVPRISTSGRPNAFPGMNDINAELEKRRQGAR